MNIRKLVACSADNYCNYIVQLRACVCVCVRVYACSRLNVCHFHDLNPL